MSDENGCCHRYVRGAYEVLPTNRQLCCKNICLFVCVAMDNHTIKPTLIMTNLMLNAPITAASTAFDSLGTEPFGVVRVGEDPFCSLPMTYSRRDYYKISLILGTGQLAYADKTAVIDRPALVFTNPLIPYAWESTSEPAGYYCLFTEPFLDDTHRPEPLQESPLFKLGSSPVFFLTDEQVSFVGAIFDKMRAEMESEYAYKQDLLRSYVNILLHEALKMQPHDGYVKPANAAHRISSLFLELLERQFPIDSPKRPLRLRTAHDFATYLSVHVNHLNRAVRQITGKTTTEHIAERVASEARALLKHTDWNTADIAYGLGFNYPTYFNTFFKKQTGLSPQSYRA